MEPDDLYGLPLEEFTAARNALAKERPEAKALRKPTLAAWAVNQLARRHRSELDSFLAAARELRDAQLGGGEVGAATTRQREALRRLLQLGGEYAGSTQIDRVRQTLQAAAVDDEAAEEVLAGRLERELEAAGFGSLLAAAPRQAPSARKTKPKRDEARERRLREAREADRDARAELKRAEGAEREARRGWERLRDEAEQARRRADEAKRRLRNARD
ncbi:MAG TPA: hypothetical protein VFI37_03180 [Gaiellaceae bacterium]|nr:hypothetical protein [Gaiellaceae bacterium]